MSRLIISQDGHAVVSERPIAPLRMPYPSERVPRFPRRCPDCELIRWDALPCPECSHEGQK